MAKNPSRREPFFRFCAPDWRSDVPLRRCSFAARGLWIDMLSLMHESDPYGELRDAGQPLSAADLVQLLGGTLKEVQKLLAELEGRNVFSRRPDGTIYSRRMERDYLKAQEARENGKTGGNPNLKRVTNPPDNPSGGHPVNGGVNPLDKPRGRTGAPGHFHIHSQKLSQPLPVGKEAARDPNFDCDGVTWKPDDRPPHEPRPNVNGWWLDNVLDRVVDAARLVKLPRDISPLVAWLQADIEPETILAAINRVASRESYKTPISLMFFDKAVREQPAQRAA